MQSAGNNKIAKMSYYRVGMIPMNKLTYDHFNHRNYSGIIDIMEIIVKFILIYQLVTVSLYSGVRVCSFQSWSKQRTYLNFKNGIDAIFIGIFYLYFIKPTNKNIV